MPRRLDNLILQIAVFLALILFFRYLFNNAVDNLQSQGIASGFDFLHHQAGFSIIMHLIDFSEQSTYLRAFFVGLLNTLLLAVLGIFFATILGLIIGILRLSKIWILAKLSAVYIEIFRNIPLLLQIFFWYFAILRTLPSPRNSYHLSDVAFFNIRGLYLPEPTISIIAIKYFLFALIIVNLLVLCKSNNQQKLFFTLTTVVVLIAFSLSPIVQWQYPVLTGFNFQHGMHIIPELIAMLVALSMYTASFIAEIVRAGILSVPAGQSEAAYSLGLPKNLTLKLIILPQSLRLIIPPLTSQYLNLTKNSSLAAAIAYPDLVAVFAGTVLNQTGQAIEVISITMSVYLAISLIISLLMNWYNHAKMF